MPRVVIAPAMATAALAVVIFFLLGGLVIGGLLLIGAEAVAKNTQGSAVAIRLGGAAITAITLYLLQRIVRQWPAIATIETSATGWRLIDRRGRAVSVPAGTQVELSLRTYRYIYMLSGIPRWQDVVDGELHAGSVRRRLAASGPFTYGKVLAALGISGSPPARGTTQRYEVRT